MNFDGGNMPSAEYLAASFSQEESGFTFIFMIIITVVVAWATAGAALAAMGAEAGAAGTALTAGEAASAVASTEAFAVAGEVAGFATAGGAAGAAGTAGISAAGYASIAGGVYTVGSGGGNLTSAQPQWFGDVGDGQITPSASGGWADPTSAVNGNWVQPELSGTQGGLNQYWQKQQPDVNEYSETNGVLLLREGTPIQSGIYTNPAQP